MPKKKISTKNDKVKVRIEGIETLRHQKELEISKEKFKHIKSLFKSKKDHEIDEFIGDMFSSASVVDGEYENCNIDVMGDDGKYKSLYIDKK